MANSILLVLVAVAVAVQSTTVAPWLWLVLVGLAVALFMLTFRGPHRGRSGLVVPIVAVTGVVAWGAFAWAAAETRMAAVVIVALAFGTVVFVGARLLRDRGWLVVPALLGPLYLVGAQARCLSAIGVDVACGGGFLDPSSRPMAAAVFALLVVVAVLFGSDHWTPDRPGMRKSHRQRHGA